MSGSLIDRWNGGAPIESFTRDERDHLRSLYRQGEAYGNAKHPEHARVMADLSALYEHDYPDQREPNLVHIDGRLVDMDRGGK